MGERDDLDLESGHHPLWALVPGMWTGAGHQRAGHQRRAELALREESTAAEVSPPAW